MAMAFQSSSESGPEAMRDSPFPYWTQGECLGAGNFGKVYKCVIRDNKILAVKVVKMEPQYTETQKEVKVLKNEIRILKKLRHVRIVSYYGSEQKDGHLHLFMDFMAGGSLSAHIKKRGVLPEEKSGWYTNQMLQGIEFLHSQNIIHRDIKGSNILLDGEGNVKLADFGLSKMIQKVGSKTDLVSHCGTPYWMAPEIFWGEGYGRKADIWSLGCTVVEMITGKPPLSHLEPAAAMFRIGSRPIEPTLPENVSLDTKEFVEAALTWKPDERPWSDALQRYQFVSKAQTANSLRLGDCIGAGAFGEVFKCFFSHQGTSTLRAVKRVKMESQYTGVNGEVQALQNEISILRKVKHERIVSYYGCEQSGGYLHLVMELMPGGSLSDHIRRSEFRFLSDHESSGYTKQMLEGVTFLHSRDIIHRDIKGSNVLLDGKRNVKLADFELSETIQKIGSETNLKSACGTSYYIAPEIFLGQGYGQKADIWSVGCTVIEMLTGKPPLSYLQPEEARFNIASGTIDVMTLVPWESQDARTFIVAALKWNPRQRPSSLELQRYAFVAKKFRENAPFQKSWPVTVRDPSNLKVTLKSQDGQERKQNLCTMHIRSPVQASPMESPPAPVSDEVLLDSPAGIVQRNESSVKRRTESPCISPKRPKLTLQHLEGNISSNNEKLNERSTFFHTLSDSSSLVSPILTT